MCCFIINLYGKGKSTYRKTNAGTQENRSRNNLDRLQILYQIWNERDCQR